MIRLVPLDIYEEVRQRARRFDWQGVLPQAHSIPGVLTIAARPRHGEPGWWSVWVVEPFKSKWWQRPQLPSFEYDLSAETGITWRNSLPQRHGLAMREGVINQVEGLPIEVLAFSTGGDLRRVWFHAGLEGVSPFVKAGHPSKPLTLPQTKQNLALAQQLRAPIIHRITEQGIEWK